MDKFNIFKIILGLYYTGLKIMIQNNNKKYFKLEISEGNHRDLKATRLALEKEITVKKNSIAIDRDRCLRYNFLSKNK